jgi:hypothetical protein
VHALQRQSAPAATARAEDAEVAAVAEVVVAVAEAVDAELTARVFPVAAVAGVGVDDSRSAAAGLCDWHASHTQLEGGLRHVHTGHCQVEEGDRLRAGSTRGAPQ